MCAALATLRKLGDPALEVYRRLEYLGAALQRGQEEIFRQHGLRAHVSRLGSASCVYLMDRLPGNWWDIVTRHHMAADTALRLQLIQRGIYQIPIPAKQASLSFAHSAEDVARTLDAYESAVSELKAIHPDAFD
jgi:glutamate-1-semialdehyde 2,1-aminomutase